MKKRFVVFCTLIPVMISLLLIGAHFLRSGNFLVPVVSLLLIMALCVREPLVARAVQLALLLATAEWLHVTFTLVSARLDAGQPWTKLALILGGVATCTLASIALFLTKPLKEMYHLGLAPVNPVPAKSHEPDRALTGPPPAEQNAETEQRRRLLGVHNLKGALTTASLLAFLLMDYSIALAMVSLIVIGLVNTSLRKKMRGIGGSLSSVEKQKLYLRQALGLCVLAVALCGYYAWSLPIVKHWIIVDSIIVGFTSLLWAASWYEYLRMGNHPA